jgi:hypothetical protein
MSNIFSKILQQSAYLPFKSDESTKWFRNLARRTTGVTAHGILSSAKTTHATPHFGSLYLFQYNAKLKDTLPYWDMFPVCIPFRSVPAALGSTAGFLGLNLHYLPPKLRAVLMDALMNTISNTKYDETTRFRVTYDLLNSLAQFRYFKPCLKHYLIDHVRSPFLYVKPEEWNLALFMPLARFQKANQSRVWTDSENAV